MIISPTESPTARALGTSSWKAELYGADMLWAARGEWWGVQRKALPDFVASVDDGRLATERMQMQGLHHAYLILESGERGGGFPRTMPNDTLAALGTYGRPWTGAQLRGVMYNLMVDGIQVMMVKDESETLARVMELEAWSRKPRHESARGRGTVPADVFGHRGNKEYAVFLLAGLPGVGVELAGRIYDHFGGLPIGLRPGVDEKSLMQVKGVGKVVAKKMVDVFGDKE